MGPKRHTGRPFDVLVNITNSGYGLIQLCSDHGLLLANTNFCRKATSAHLASSFAFTDLDSDWSHCPRSPLMWINREAANIQTSLHAVLISESRRIVSSGDTVTEKLINTHSRYTHRNDLVCETPKKLVYHKLTYSGDKYKNEMHHERGSAERSEARNLNSYSAPGK